MTNWQTPREFYESLNRVVGGFAVDAAADSSNHLAPVWYGPGGDSPDALAVDKWLSPAWCNPPYGRGIDRWVKKFIEQRHKGVTTVALLPANTETRWWYDYVVGNAGITFLVSRLPFVNPERTKQSQPDHGSAICVFEPPNLDHVYRPVVWLDWKARLVGNSAHGVDGGVLSILRHPLDGEDHQEEVERGSFVVEGDLDSGRGVVPIRGVRG